MIALGFGASMNTLFITLIVSGIVLLLLLLFYYISLAIDAWDGRNIGTGINDTKPLDESDIKEQLKEKEDEEKIENKIIK